MKVLATVGFTIAGIWAACLIAVGMQRFIEWRERRHWERKVFDPSHAAMVTALEDMIEGASK